MTITMIPLRIFQLLFVSYALPQSDCLTPVMQSSARAVKTPSSPPPRLCPLWEHPTWNRHDGERSSSHRKETSLSSSLSSSSIRRCILLSLATPSSALLLLPKINFLANAAETPAETIRLLTSKTIPGLGPPDIYYPPYFIGTWKVTFTITTSDEDFWQEMKSNGINLPITIVSKMRFIPYDAGKDYISNDNATVDNKDNKVPVIADRAYNEQSYYAAMSTELNRLYSTTKPAFPPIQLTTWTPTNPNVLSISYTDGSSREIKVTKRSLDVSNDGNAIFSSEFRRITRVPSPSSNGIGIGGIPSIYKSRVLTKWKQQQMQQQDTVDSTTDVNRIEGIEIAYNENGTFGDKDRGMDPLLGSGKSSTMAGSVPSPYGNDTKDLADWRSTKTKIIMERE